MAKTKLKIGDYAYERIRHRKSDGEDIFQGLRLQGKIKY